MKEITHSRREFAKKMGLAAGGLLLSSKVSVAGGEISLPGGGPASAPDESGSPDYTLHIQAAPVEIAPNRIVSVTTYNGKFPGPLLRFREGRQTIVDVFND
ncbi:MAG: multicopper oxidase domain-containing protein, partial [Candidatus Acidiferrales bacterium]